MAQPWEQQEGESAKAFAGFQIYRDMNENRSFAKVAQTIGKSDTWVGRWGSKWGWVARARAYDEDLDRIRRHASTQAIIDMSARQARMGQLLQTRGLKRIADMDEAKIASLSVFEATRLIESGVRVERMARGEAVDFPAEPPQERRLDIIEILRRDPSRIGPVVETLGHLRDQFPELAPGPKVVGPDDDDEEEDEEEEPPAKADEK